MAALVPWRGLLHVELTPTVAVCSGGAAQRNAHTHDTDMYTKSAARGAQPRARAPRLAPRSPVSQLSWSMRSPRLLRRCAAAMCAARPTLDRARTRRATPRDGTRTHRTRPTEPVQRAGVRGHSRGAGPRSRCGPWPGPSPDTSGRPGRAGAAGRALPLLRGVTHKRVGLNGSPVQFSAGQACARRQGEAGAAWAAP